MRVERWGRTGRRSGVEDLCLGGGFLAWNLDYLRIVVSLIAVLAGVLTRARRGALYNGNCGSYLCKGSMSGAALSFSFGTGDLYISG